MSVVKRLNALSKVVVFGLLLATFFLAPFTAGPVVADGGSGGRPGTPPGDDSTGNKSIIDPAEETLSIDVDWQTMLRFVEI